MNATSSDTPSKKKASSKAKSKTFVAESGGEMPSDSEKAKQQNERVEDSKNNETQRFSSRRVWPD